jgi:Na+/H+ antiporter NhaC
MISYIDTSYYSIALGLITFVLVFVLARFLLLKYEKDPEKEEDKEGMNYKVLGISVVIAIVVSFFSLIGYKQYIVSKGSSEILRDEF